MQCARCRNEIPAHSRFCLACGQPVQAAPPPRTVMPPAPSAAPAGFVPTAAAQPSRRPVGPLIISIAILLVAVATLGTFLTIHSLVAASRKGHPGEFVAAPPPNLGAKPITPAPNPQPTPSAVVINTPKQEGMPLDVLAYLSWLAQQNEDRLQAERDGEGVMAEMAAQLVTSGFGVEGGTREDNPVDEHMATFRKWSDELAELHRRVKDHVGLEYYWQKLKAPGSPHVPDQCVLLDGMYRNALGLQVDAAQQVAAYIAAKDIGGASRQIKASNRAVELQGHADAEVGRVCALYHVPQWFHISTTPGETPNPVLLPH